MRIITSIQFLIFLLLFILILFTYIDTDASINENKEDLVHNTDSVNTYIVVPNKLNVENYSIYKNGDYYQYISKGNILSRDQKNHYITLLVLISINFVLFLGRYSIDRKPDAYVKHILNNLYNKKLNKVKKELENIEKHKVNCSKPILEIIKKIENEMNNLDSSDLRSLKYFNKNRKFIIKKVI